MGWFNAIFDWTMGLYLALNVMACLGMHWWVNRKEEE